MRGLPTLKGRISLWSGVVFLVLYAAAFAVFLFLDSRQARRDLEIILYAEAEALAGYVAATDRLDFPELVSPTPHTPLPVWLRLTRGQEVLAATPQSPEAPDSAASPTVWGRLVEWTSGDGVTLFLVRHQVWNRPEMAVEAMTSAEVLRGRRWRLSIGLAAIGGGLMLLALLGGWLVADQALRPLEALVHDTRSLGSDDLDARLDAPGAVVEVTQITREFNHLLDRLVENIRAMRRFTADASHELRTPITILRTGLEVALRRQRSAEEYENTLRENLTEIERVQRVVDGLLTLARAQGEAEPKIIAESVDFSRIVTEVMRTTHAAAAKKNISFESRVDSGAIVSGNADLLRLMVLNLLDNAVKFTPLGKRVWVDLQSSRTRTRLQVEDEGSGVRPEDRDRIFDRFYRGASPNSSVAGGIGLSVAQWVAESHGGKVRLAEGRRGGGAKFKVTLPRISPTASPEPPMAKKWGSGIWRIGGRER